jgi:diacylglycerol O-acyltransferase / wax synthase
VVLISRGGFATVTTRYDRAAISDPDLWARCLRRGFDEVLVLAGDPHPRVVPASFPDQPDQSKASPASGTFPKRSVAYS